MPPAPASPGPSPDPRRDALARVRWIGKAEFDAIFAAWEARIRGVLEGDGASWAIVGIKRRGAVLARRLWRLLSPRGDLPPLPQLSFPPQLPPPPPETAGGTAIAGARPLPYGEIDISLYRDDYHLQTEKPMVLGTEISFPVEGVKILLVDDVLYTGRTVRAAMDLILDFGRPRLICLAAFIDRGHRELPISADLTGKVVTTERGDQVLVTLAEMGEEDGVDLIRKAGPKAKTA